MDRDHRRAAPPSDDSRRRDRDRDRDRDPPPRDQRARNNADRDRSRSPPYRERRDERRRERSPIPSSRRGQHGRADENRFSARGDSSRQDERYTDAPAQQGARGSKAQGRQTGNQGRVGGAGQPASGGGTKAINGAGGSGGGDAHMSNGVPEPAAMSNGADRYEDEDEEAQMQRIMGFAGFRSTKNTKVPGNDRNYAVNKLKKVEYRQYMNRKGGFNRPLSPQRD